MSYYVYQHHKADTGDIFYVGKGKGLRCMKIRGRNQYWKNVVNKHGFTHSIIADNLDEELAFLLEAEVIDKYRKLGYQLVNATDGGEGASGYKHSEDHKKQMLGNTYWKLVKNNGFKGKTHSDEQKAKWKESRKGVTSPRKGVMLSDETRQKISMARKGKPCVKKRALTSEQVLEVRVMLQTQTIAATSRHFNVGESTIRRIRNGERYGDVK
jgi:group I intron endonuclease